MKKIIVNKVILALTVLVMGSSAFSQNWSINDSTVAHWIFDDNPDNLNQNVFKNHADWSHNVVWQVGPGFETVNGTRGVQCNSSNNHGVVSFSSDNDAKPYTVDSAYNPEQVISYGIKVYLQDSHPYMVVMGFYEGLKIGIAPDGAINLGLQTDYHNYPAGWFGGITQSGVIDDDGEWHEIVVTVDATNPNDIKLYVWADSVEYPLINVGGHFDYGVRTWPLSTFNIASDPVDHYPLFGLVSEAIVQQGFMPTSVAIDVKPGSDSNSINPRSKGVISVAVLTDGTFDATLIDAATIKFGPNGATPVHGIGHAEDMDDDGDIDMLFHFSTQETGIACGDTETILTGETFGGEAIVGVDYIQTVGCKK